MEHSGLPALRVLPADPPELVVHDQLSRCPYLPDQQARMPLRLPVRVLTRRELDQRLSAGDRRQGVLLYHTSCPECEACVPVRIIVDEFEPSATQRRTLRRNDAVLEVRAGRPSVDVDRVQLYNLHKELRGLSDEGRQIDAAIYADFLVATHCESFELSYWYGDQLVGVALVDRGAESLSAVYCCWDPCHRRLSLGTYSILKQWEICKKLGLKYLYLGLMVEGSEPMKYKGLYLPQERRIHGRWVRFDGT